MVGQMVGQGSWGQPKNPQAMPRKKTRKAKAGSGSVYWSAAQQRYVGEVTLGRDERGVRVKKVLVGPRGDKGDDARLELRIDLSSTNGNGRRSSAAWLSRAGRWASTLTNGSPPSVASRQKLRPITNGRSRTTSRQGWGAFAFGILSASKFAASSADCRPLVTLAKRRSIRFFGPR